MITNNGNLPYQANELGLKSQSVTWSLYNISFTADLPNSEVNNTGIFLKGSLGITGIPGLGNTSLQVEKCHISTKGEIQEVVINVNPNPELNLYSWKMIVKSATLNQYGFKMGGNMNIKIPQTNDMNVSFSNLTLNASSITGGIFFIPANVSLLGIVNYSAPFGSSFQLGKVPGKNAYRLSGTGMVEFTKLLTQNIPLEYFSVATSGDLEIKAKPEISYDIMSVAGFNISKFDLNTSIPEVTVGGKIALYLPGFNLGAGSTLRFKKNNVASIDDISFKISLNSVGSLSANTSFTGKGFKGSGKLKIANSDISEISTGFLYENISAGIKLDVNVTPGLPPIPLVGTVSIENIGGKISLNTSNNIYAITLSGRVVVAPGSSALVSLDPVAVTVEASSSGPVLQGDATAKIISWNVGKAEFRIDYPNKLLLVKGKMGGGFNLLPGVSVSGNQEVIFTACAKPNDPYWLAGMYANIKLASLINANGAACFAWNLSKANHPEFNDYTSFIPGVALDNGKINGANLHAAVHIGSSDEDCIGNFFGSLCAWAEGNTEATLYSNFTNPAFGFHLSTEWGGGGSAKLFGYGAASAKVSASGDLKGGYNNNSGWYFNGKASGHARAKVGCCYDDCRNKICAECCIKYIGCTCPCGAKICFSLDVDVGYSDKDGLDVGVDVF